MKMQAQKYLFLPGYWGYAEQCGANFAKKNTLQMIIGKDGIC